MLWKKRKDRNPDKERERKREIRGKERKKERERKKREIQTEREEEGHFMEREEKEVKEGGREKGRQERVVCVVVDEVYVHPAEREREQE